MKGFEQALHGMREERQRRIDRVYSGPDATEEDLMAWANGANGPEEGPIRSIMGMDSRTYLGMLFERLKNVGSTGFSKAMSQFGYNNALFLARHYNHKWNGTFSANIGRLSKELINGIEKRKRTSLERILDAGCGPLVVSRMLGRPTIGVDMLRYQLEYGVEAMEELGIEGSQAFMGDMCNLAQLVPFAEDVPVFNPEKVYEKTVGIEDESLDLVIASLSIDLLNQEGRYKFLRGAHRVLEEDKFAVLLLHTKAIDEGSRLQFVRDVESCGFRDEPYFTGTYIAQNVLDRETGEQAKGGIEAFAIVAQKDSSVVEPTTQPELRLFPDYEIIESGTPSKRRMEKAGKRTPQILGYSFLKVEDSLALNDVVPEAADMPDHRDTVRGIADAADDDDIRRVLDDIAGAFEDDEPEEESEEQ